jgi:CubicO group peptidase (beta-lactamase class C family)
MQRDKLNKVLTDISKNIDFSGVVLVQTGEERICEAVQGFANRAEKLANNIDTRFGIASGCKLFTAIGICQLVEQGKLTFNTRLNDCLDINFPYYDEEITIHHLLTHSAGIPDYFDEAVMDNFEDLWEQNPMYLFYNLSNFLPMFQNKEMMFKPGEKFQYNNAAFIILGLIIEQQTGLSFTKYVEDYIFQPAGMEESGYFSLDQLPQNTALGYIDNNEDGTWKTNTYSIPIKGGADGGAFITAPEMVKLWKALFEYRLLNEETTKLLLTPHICEKDEEYYGYGIWISKKDDKIFKYHVMGYDPGVSFHAAVYSESGTILVIPSNKETGPFAIMKAFEENLLTGRKSII